MPQTGKDIFLCHAGEDKAAIVRPLSEALERAGISFWLDEAEIRWGGSISAQIEQGLSTSRYILVVLSPSLTQKVYPQGELRSVLHQQLNTGKVRLLPLLAGPESLIREHFPLLGDSAHVAWNDDPERVAHKLLALLHPERSATSRACFISSEYPLHVLGGLGVHVGQLTRALAEHLEVDVVLPTESGDPYRSLHPSVRLYPLAQAPATYEEPVSWLRFADLAAKRIARLAREARPAVLHCHDWVTVLAGLKCRWTLGIPLVFHLHLPNRGRLCAAVENLGLICADLVTVNSEAMHDALMNRSLPLRGGVEVIENGVDLAAFHPCDDWPEDEDYVLFVGRLVKQKGVEHLLRAFVYVKEKFPDIRLKIVGDGDLRPALEGLAASRLLADRVDFLGWVTGPDLVRLYQKARVVTIPSIYEPFGMTALEALACQRPVVASRTGGLREIVRSGVSGYLAQPQDELDLAQWLMTLLSSAELRHRMGTAGLADVSRECYAWSEIAKRYVGFYRSLAGKALDLTVPPRAVEFTHQALEIARADPRAPSDLLLAELFDWMMSS